MKKKIASLTLVLALCLSLLPVTAFAEGDGAKSSITVCGETWADTTYAKTNAGAVSKEGASDTNYNIYWNADTSTLTLNNANIKLTPTETVPSVISADIESLNIVLIGSNSIEVTNEQNAGFTALSNTGKIHIGLADDQDASLSIVINQTNDLNTLTPPYDRNIDLVGVYTGTGLTNEGKLTISIAIPSDKDSSGNVFGIEGGVYKSKSASLRNDGTIFIDLKDNSLSAGYAVTVYGVILYGGSLINNGTMDVNAYTTNGKAYGLRGTNTTEVWENSGTIKSTATAYGGNISNFTNSYKFSNHSNALSIVTSDGANQKAHLVNSDSGIMNLYAINYGKNAFSENVCGIELDSEDTLLNNAGTINVQALEANSSGIYMYACSKDEVLTNSGTIEIKATTNGQCQGGEQEQSYYATATGIGINLENYDDTPLQYKTALNLESGSTLTISATTTENAEEGAESQAVQLQKVYYGDPRYETAPQEITMSDDLVVLEGGSPLAVQLEEYVDYGMYVYINGFSEDSKSGNFSKTVKIITAQPLTGSVSISGTVKNGNVLSADLANIPEGLAVKYQWQVGDSANGTFTDIENATEATYRLTSAEVGKYVRVVVTTDDVSYKGSLVATTTQAVEAKSSSSSRPRYDVTTPSKPENGSVTVDPERARSGSRVTVTVTPDSGYKLGELVVTDKDGKKLELTDKGNGQYTFTMPSGKVEVAAEFVKEVEVSPFADVATDAYYYDAVKWAVEKGVTNGVSETLFGPDQACTRAQIVTFLWRAAGSPEPKSGSSFADVAADAYYAKAVAWAVENGITKGTSETTFHPDETCTRAQGVTFLYRALGKLAAAQAGFTDVAADSYYADAVNWAAENGVTKGISETLFGPDGSCTRAQIVTFLYRAYQGK